MRRKHSAARLFSLLAVWGILFSPLLSAGLPRGAAAGTLQAPPAAVEASQPSPYTVYQRTFGFGPITSVAYAPDNEHALIGTLAGFAAQVSLSTGLVDRYFDGSTGPIAYSPDGSRVVTAGGSFVRLWDAADGQLLQIWTHISTVNVVAFSPDGRQLLTGTYYGGTLHDLAGGAAPTRFGSDVQSAAWSPDGTTVLTGDFGGVARLWNAASGTLVDTIQVGQSPITSLAFAPDGTTFAVAASEATASLWTIAGAKLRTYDPAQNGRGCCPIITGVAFSSGGQLLTADMEGVVQLWSATTGQLERTLGQRDARSSNASYQSSSLASFGANGARVLAADMTGRARLWDAASGALIREWDGHGSGVTAVATSPDGALVLTGGNDQRALLWNAGNGELVRAFEGHTDRVTAVDFSPNGAYVATGSQDTTARLWDAETGELLRTFAGHGAGVASAARSESVTSVAISVDGRRIATGSGDGQVRVWDMQTGALVRTIANKANGAANTSAVHDIVFAPDGVRLLAAGSDYAAYLWDTTSGQLLRAFEHPRVVDGQPIASGAIYTVAFAPNGRTVFTGGSGDGLGRLWDATTGNQLWAIDVPTYVVDYTGRRDWGAFIAASFSPDAQLLLLNGADNTAMLVDAGNGRLLRAFEGHSARVASVSFMPDGKRIVTASADGTTRLWSARTATPLHDLPPLGSLRAFSPNGRYLFTIDGSDQANSKVISTRDGALVAAFDNADEGHVQAAAFSPDSSKVLISQASALGDVPSAARLWDIAGKQLIRTFENGGGEVAFAPSGHQVLVASGADARLWDVDSGRLIHTFATASEYIASVAFSDDGRYALLGTTIGAQLWDVATGQKLRTFGEAGFVTAAISPDGTRVLTIGLGSVTLWDVENGARIHTIVQPNGIDCSNSGYECQSAVFDVGFAAGGRLLIAQSRGGTHVWDARSGELALAFDGGLMSPDGALFARSLGNSIQLSALDWRPWETRRATPLALGRAVDGQATTGEWADYSVEVTKDQSLLVQVTPAVAGQPLALYGEFGALPTLAFAPLLSETPTARGTYDLLVSPTENGTYYFGVFGAGAAAASRGFRIEARVAPRYLSDVTPRAAGNAGDATLHVTGLGFAAGMRAELRASGAATRPSSSALPIGRTELQARFDLRGATPGGYTLAVIWPDGGEQLLPGALQISIGSGARVETALTNVPQTVRPGRPYTLRIDYRNAGDADAVAPLFMLSSTPAVPMKTACGDAYAIGTLMTLGVNPNGPAGALAPGAGGRIAVQLQIARNPDFEKIDFKLDVMQPSNVAVAWDTYKVSMRPGYIGATEWNALWPTLKTRLGVTWGDYLRVLGANAEVLRQRGLPSACVGDLLRLEIEQARGASLGSIGGQLLDQVTKAPVSGATVVARSSDGQVLQNATTDLVDGTFAVSGLPAGRYTLYVEDYALESVVTVDLAEGQQRNELVLLARRVDERPVVASTTPDDPGAQHPVLVADGSGGAYLVWQRGEQLWQSRYSDGTGLATGWSNTQAITGTNGANPALAFSPTLGGAPGVVAVWQDGITNTARLRSAIGRPDAAGGLAWSEPITITEDRYGDTNPAVAVGKDGQPLALWLQRDWAVEEDTDLYSKPLNAAAFPAAARSARQGLMTGQATVEQTTAAVPQQVTGCFVYILHEKTKLPPQIPVLGGKYGFEFKLNVCPPPEMCKIAASLEGEGALFFSDSVSGVLAGKGSAEWSTNKQQCRYLFNKGAVEVKAAIKGEIPLGLKYLVTPNAPLFLVQFSATAKGDATGRLIWEGVPFPGAPSSGEVVMNASVGGTAKAYILGFPPEFVEGVAAFEVFPRLTHRWPGGWQVDPVCLKVEGAIGSKWWRRSVKMNAEWSLSSGEMKCAAAPQRSALAATATEPGLVATYDPLVGTGAVYEGQPVLGSSITTDTSNDGKASIARSPSGELVAAWTKERPASSPDQGAAVVVASHDGTGWGAPVELQSAQFFNQQTAVTFDTSGNPMVVWASAPATIATTASSDQFFAAVKNTDMFFSRRVNGVWSAAAPIATVPGWDTGVQLATQSYYNRIMAAWIHTENGASTLYSSMWDGSTWSVPATIPVGTLVDTLSLAGTRYSWIMAWTQDDTGTDASGRTFALYSATGGTAWSAPERIAVPPLPSTAGPITPSAADAGVTLQAGGWGLSAEDQPAAIASQGLFRFPPYDPPVDCCKDEPVDPNPAQPDPDQPNPPLPPAVPNGEAPLYEPGGSGASDVVASEDPNEKIGPRGNGAARRVAVTDTLEYAIHFENKATATAPAQEVFIDDQLDSNLDWTTFRFIEAGFGDTVAATDGTYQVHTRQTMRDHRSGIDKLWWVDITGEINPLTGHVRWAFRMLDPDTGELPEDALAGFLPAEDGTGRGQGHVRFSVRPRADVPPGALTGSAASIVFDTNDPIVTNEWTNAIGGGGNIYLPLVRR